MTVADKFTPVSTTPRKTDPVGPMLVGAVVLAAALWVFSARDVATDIAQDDGLASTPGLAPTTEAVAQVADGVGLTALREAVDALVVPFHDSPRVLRAPEPEPEPEPEPVLLAPPEPEAPPGARWLGPAEGGPHVERLLLVGASSIQYALGTELERHLEEDYTVEVRRHGKLGTGLTRDDVYDWLGVIAEEQASFRPQAVVAQFGGNDCQPIVVDGERHAFGTEAWDAAFTERLQRLAAQVQSGGARLVFLGMPPMREPGFDGRIQRYNRVARAAIEQAGGRWVPVRDLAGDADGNYQVAGPVGGRSVRLRMSDGIHFTRTGAAALAPALAQRLEQHLTLVPADAQRAVAMPGILASAARQEDTHYLAFVPREVPEEGLPGVLLLHGAWGSWRDWSEHAHDDLARLSAELGLVLVLPDGRPFGWYLDSPVQQDAQLQRYFVEELVPHLTERLPVHSWGATGLSMGGHGAMTLALEHPEVLSSVTALSSVPDLSDKAGDAHLEALLGPYETAPERWHAHSTTHLLAEGRRFTVPLLVTCGEQDKWFSANQALHDQLEALGVPHTFEPGPGGHDWDYWTGQLPRHLAFHAEHLGGADQAAGE